MDIKELIQRGDLAEARKQLVAAVKASPADSASRTLLFQVLCYSGEWDKAARHLEAIATQDGDRGAGAIGYSNIIQAEKERGEVFKKNQNGSFISDPPDYLNLFLQLRKNLSEKKESESRELLAELDSLCPTVSGTVNDTPFVGFCDTDTTLFPFLEVIAHERYLWVPFESIRELSISQPATLLDLLWISARITTWEGLTMNCSLPVLYPNSCHHGDAGIRMGRVTDWQPLAGHYTQGLGQHVFDVGGTDMALLEIREVVFNFPGKKERDEEKS